MTDAERQRRRRDRLKGDLDEATAVGIEAKAARIANEILEFVGIELVTDVLERCLAGHDGDDDDGVPTGAPYYDFETCIPGDEKPRLYRLLKELDELIVLRPGTTMLMPKNGSHGIGAVHTATTEAASVDLVHRPSYARAMVEMTRSSDAPGKSSECRCGRREANHRR